MSQSSMSLDAVQRIAQSFADERGWGKFHNPKDVAVSLAIEAAEVLECFQWRKDDACTSQRFGDNGKKAVASELADVVLYAATLANALDIDLSAAVHAKVVENEERYRPGVEYFPSAI